MSDRRYAIRKLCLACRPAVVVYCHLAARAPVRYSTSLVAQLSEWSGLSRATVKRSLSELKRVGAVRWQ
jgi:hypothetical protein